MHSNLKINAGRILLSVQYLIAYFAVLSIGCSSETWFFIVSAVYVLIVLLSRYSPAQKLSPVPVEQHSTERLPRSYGQFFSLLLTASSIAYFFSTATPAQAQFYQESEIFLTSCFPAAAVAISLIMNILRAFFLLYLAIALVRAITTVLQQGGDLAPVITPPLIVTAVLTLGDVLSGLIIGGVTC
ncbi:MAG: hypothetical protein F6K31_07860 [Symploca sp. SIO2G7]|nr:hypothetical protein [Symploca sp. SIO2G7]